jgi:hypothetical protein
MAKEVTDTDDGLLKLMRHAGIPITREDYLNLAYMGEPPAALTPEQEEMCLRRGKRREARDEEIYTG